MRKNFLKITETIKLKMFLNSREKFPNSYIVADRCNCSLIVADRCNCALIVADRCNCFFFLQSTTEACDVTVILYRTRWGGGGGGVGLKI